MTILAQTQVPTPLLIALGLLIVAVIVGGVVLIAVRNAASKAFLRSQREERAGGLGLMDEMRRLRESGAMSHEEYQRVRANLINRAQREAVAGVEDDSGGPMPDKQTPTQAIRIDQDVRERPE